MDSTLTPPGNGTPLSVHEPETAAPRGGIIVIQEAFGVNEHIEDVCRRFAAEGYLVVAPHLFHRTGDPTIAYSDMNAVRQHLGALTAHEILHDLDAARQRLASAGIPSARIGVTGFCMGGTIALVTACRREIGAAVSFYGGGITEGRYGFRPLADEAPQLRAPWLGLFRRPGLQHPT
jgi:carboxymethylenebutenolidase